MRNVNTCSYTSYALQNILWTVLAFIEYRLFLFMPLPGLDKISSMCILAGSVVLLVIAGAAITYENRRNDVSIAINVLGGFEVYFVITFRYVYFTAIAVMGGVAITAAVIYGSLVIYFYFRDRHKKAYYTILNCLKATFLSMRTLAVAILSVLMFTTAVLPILGLPLLSGKNPVETESVYSHHLEVQPTENNMRIILLFQENSWDALDIEKKVGALQAIADMEADRLGIEKVAVVGDRLSANTLGQYAEDTRTISINLTSLLSESARTNLHTVIHEVYHAYENRLVQFFDGLREEDKKLYLFNEAIQYKDEFTDYISGYDDYEAYASQACEVDSDAYADERLEYYNDVIREYRYNSD